MSLLLSRGRFRADEGISSQFRTASGCDRDRRQKEPTRLRMLLRAWPAVPGHLGAGPPPGGAPPGITIRARPSHTVVPCCFQSPACAVPVTVRAEQVCDGDLYLPGSAVGVKGLRQSLADACVLG